jgi:hypothetical protein
MVFRMKTTLIIPDPVFRELKRRAIERGETMSNLVTEFLRRGLTEKPETKPLPPLPSFHMGEALVDISNREELYRIFDEEKYGIRYDTGDED